MVFKKRNQSSIKSQERLKVSEEAGKRKRQRGERGEKQKQDGNSLRSQELSLQTEDTPPHPGPGRDSRRDSVLPGGRAVQKGQAGGGSSSVPPRPPSRLEGALARKHRASNLAPSPQGSHPPAYQRRTVFSCVRSQKTLTLPVPLPVSRGNDEGKEARRAGFPDSGPGRPQVREGGLGGRDQGDVSQPGKGRRAEAELGPWRVPQSRRNRGP